MGVHNKKNLLDINSRRMKIQTSAFFLNYTDSWSGQQERAASSGYPTEEFAVEVFLYVECENKCAD